MAMLIISHIVQGTNDSADQGMWASNWYVLVLRDGLLQ